MAQGQDLLDRAGRLAQPGRLDHHLTVRGTPWGSPNPSVVTADRSRPGPARRRSWPAGREQPQRLGRQLTRPASSITESASCLVASASIAPWRR